MNVRISNYFWCRLFAPCRSRTIRQTLLFQIICWLLAAYLYLSNRLLGMAEYDHIKVIIPIRYSLTIVQGTVAAIFIGLILGTVDLLLVDIRIRKRSFGFLVIVKALVYISTIFIVLSGVNFFTGIFVDHDSLPLAFSKLIEFYEQKFLLSMLIYALVISFLVSFIKQVSQKFGPRDSAEDGDGEIF